MQIDFPKEPPKYLGSDLMLVFPVEIDGKRVQCSITVAALEDHFGALSSRAEDTLDAFSTHRLHIEEVAHRLLSETHAGCRVLRSGYVRFYKANARL